MDEPTLRAVCGALRERYGDLRLGNPVDPLDDLVFILLSNKTAPSTCERTFALLKAQFVTWTEVANVDPEVLEAVLRPAGFAKLRSTRLITTMRTLTASFGEATLLPLHSMNNSECERFLRQLPGVSAKVAKCVMLYTLGREVLPVDSHVHRVGARLGLPTKRRPDTSQDLLEASVPASLRFTFHVGAIALGRDVCRPHNPRCSECCVAHLCEYSLKAC